MIRLGVLSDIHGNLHALRAVLDDMRARQVDVILFAGDVAGELNYPREAIACLLGAGSVYAVRGNRERYFQNLEGKDQHGWNDTQFAPVYWNFRQLPDETRACIEAWPERLRLEWDGLPPVMMAHELERLASGDIATMLYELSMGGVLGEWNPAIGEEIVAYAEQMRCEGTLDKVGRALGAGVFIAGHLHMQWHYRHGDMLLVNPGSCGLPLDHMVGAPYTLLTGDAGRWNVEEMRVPYDVDAAVADLKVSSLYAASPVFGMTTIAQLRAAEHWWNPLLCAILDIAAERGVTETPIDNALWDEATALWLSRQDERFFRLCE